jgi:hypothetical protein
MLYSYRSSAKAAKEESDWLHRAKKEKAYSSCVCEIQIGNENYRNT